MFSKSIMPLFCGIRINIPFIYCTKFKRAGQIKMKIYLIEMTARMTICPG